MEFEEGEEEEEEEDDDEYADDGRRQPDLGHSRVTPGIELMAAASARGTVAGMANDWERIRRRVFASENAKTKALCLGGKAQGGYWRKANKQSAKKC